jgi:hypothetical protein
MIGKSPTALIILRHDAFSLPQSRMNALKAPVPTWNYAPLIGEAL